MAQRTESRSRQSGTSRSRETGNPAKVDKQDLAGMKADELRRMAREAGIERTSGMRKDELIQALTKRSGRANRSTGAGKADSGANSRADSKARKTTTASAGGGRSGGVRKG